MNSRPIPREQLRELFVEVRNVLADDLGLPALPAPSEAEEREAEAEEFVS